MVDNNDASRILAEQFAKGLESTSKLLHELQTDVHSGAVAMKGVTTEVSALRDDVKSLSKILRDESSDRSLIGRLLSAEKNIESVKEWIDENKKMQKTAEANKWQLRVAIIAGILSLTTTLAQSLFGHFLH
jgi:nitrogen regulatory protein PII-like uncharacterized protein